MDVLGGVAHFLGESEIDLRWIVWLERPAD